MPACCNIMMKIPSWTISDVKRRLVWFVKIVRLKFNAISWHKLGGFLCFLKTTISFIKIDVTMIKLPVYFRFEFRSFFQLQNNLF